jgi:NAD(P)H-dependent FMN reductase/ketosteroid isomerase-like protein
MTEPASIAILVGSLRSGSHSRRLAQALAARAPSPTTCRFVEIGDLPLYNEDLDDRPPANWTRFREEIAASDAILFVTPEYNRSLPGCLKNAIDVGSRPQGKSVFNGMPAGVVSVTPYKLGAFGANHALRQTFVFLNMPVMQQPEAYIGSVADLLDEAGKPKSNETAEFLSQFMASFASWIETVRGHASSHGFDRFMVQREEVAQAYVRGDAEPLDAIVTRRDPASFFSPKGDCLHGAAAVATRYKTDAGSFSPQGISLFEVLQSGASGDLAFWTGVQRATVTMKGKDDETPMALRVTELFRFEDGAWKLVHRHADMKDESGG